MSAATPQRVAVLVLRAWTEGHPPSLRVRITRTQDVAARSDVTSVATTASQVQAEVDAWLQSFVTGAAGEAAPGATEP